MKRFYIKSLFAALLLLCSTVASAQDFEVDGIYYSITDATAKTVQVVSSGDNSKYSGNVVIPDKVTYNGTYSVTRIGNNAFNGCTGLTSVTIGNSVTSIGAYAFDGCTGLTAVHISDLAAWYKINFSSGTSNPLSYAHNLYLNGEKVTDLVIPSGITDIKQHAFDGCSGLKSIVIPNSVTSIGRYAFEGCTGLTSVTIPNSVTGIGERAFRQCGGLTSVTIGNSVTSIGRYAFEYCRGLASIEIPGSVTSIEEGAFGGCSGLASITIPNSVTSIGSWAFSDCSGLTSVTIPNSVTSIGNYAFNGCTGLTSVTIPNSVTGIGSGAFRGCSSLTSVTIPNRVTSIGNNAFENCNGLKTVINLSSLTFSKGSTDYGYVAYYANDVINATNGSVEGDFVFGIIDGVNTLCRYIGAGGDVTLPENYNGESYVIGADAFKDNTAISGITIPNSVTGIGDSAFSGCTGLASITIPNSVTSIGSRAFSDCSGLTSITIPNSVTGIGDSAFSGCTGLASITIPNSVTSIGSRAFSDCSGLTSVTIPNSVTSIEGYAFNGCSSLTSITIPNSVTSIGESAFNSCINLTSVTIGNSVTSIGERAFLNCYGLTSITIPNSVTSIGRWAFSDCTGLKTVINLSSLTFSKGSTDYGYVAYYAENVINGPFEGDFVFGIIDGVNTLCGYVGAGGDVTLPENYNGESYVIGADVFKNNTAITSVTIGNSVTGIGSSAFFGCSGLKTVINLSSLTFSKGSTDYGYVAYYADNVTNATNGSVEGDFVFDIIDGVNTLCGYVGAGGYVTLPENYNGESYVIGADAFKDNTAISGITIPNRVTSIGDNAFNGCSGLTSVTIGDNVTSIGDDAFTGCYIRKTIWLTNTPPSGYLNAEGQINYVANNQYSSLSNVVVYPYLSSLFEVDGIKYVPVSPAERTCDAIDCIYDTAMETVNIAKTVSYKNIVMNVKEVKPYICFGNSNIKTLNISNGGSIDKSAFYGCSGLTSVTIGNSVTSIGDYAFRGCSGLTSVTIGNSVTSIGDYAFRGCSGLTSVTIGNSVTSIGESAFNGCSSLTSVTIPNSVTSIEGYAFNGCSNLTSIEIPGSVTSIEEGAFGGCSGLASITIPNSVTSIKGSAFSDCSGLTAVHISDLAAWCKINFSDVDSNPLSYAHNLYLNGEKVTDLVIPYGVTEINSYAFNGCSGLTSVTIPNSVTSIGRYAFENCSGLTSIEIPGSVTSIEEGAFGGCKGLASITIPNSVTSIGSWAFSDCSGLTSVTIGNSVTCIGERAFNGCSGLTSVTIGNSVTDIGRSAFFGCSGLTSIVIPNRVKSIGGWAFNGCSGLKTVINLSSLTFSKGSTDYGYVAYYADKVTNATNGSIEGDYIFGVFNGVNTLYEYLGDGGNITLPESYYGDNYVIAADVFKNNTAITNVTIPNSVTGIGDSAFSGCTGLASVTIGNSVTSIEEYAFEGCTGLTAVHISDLAAWCRIDFSNYYSNPLSHAHNLYLNGEKVTDLVIPSGITGIKQYAFYACSSLTSVTIPNSVTSIGESAFSDCSGLKTIINLSLLTFSKGSTDYGYVAYYADKVTNATNGSIEGDYIFSVFNGVNTLYEYLGDGGNITLPESYYGDNYVIAADVFMNNTAISGITIPNSVTGIGDSAFSGCTGLASVTIGNSVTSIGERAFRGCTGLTSIVIPNSVTGIGSSAFENCSGLTSIEIPGSVTSIEKGAFENCASLTSVTIGNSVTSIGDNAFNGCSGLKTVINLSLLTFSKGSTDYGYVAHYADKVINEPNCSVEGDFVFYSKKNSIFRYTTAHGLPGTVVGSNHIWESPVINRSTNGVRITVFATNVSDSYRGYPIVALGELEFYDSNGKKINYTERDVTTNSLEGTEGSLAGLCDGDYSTFYHSTWRYGTVPNDYVYLDINFPQTVDAFKIKMVGRNTQRCVPTEIGVTITGGTSNTLVAYTGNDTAIALPENFNGMNYVVSARAFEGYSALSEIKIPQAVASIGNYAFKGCSSLANVIIENRDVALSLGSNGSSPLFADCPLDSVYIGGKINYNTSSSYGYSPFYRNTSLRSVVIADTEEQIYDNEFYGCSGLKNVQIGNGVKSIGKWAFSGCSSLDYLIVGANVSSIGQEAFSDCTNVTTIYAYATVPPVCGTQALEDISKWNCTLLVPKESITKYQSAEQWKDFFFISEIPAETLPGDVNEDGRVSVADITTVVDAILNESSDAAYDVNGDSRVSVADITTIVDIILNEGASAASNAPARVATRSTSALSLYIDPFEINAGEEKDILVNLSNPGTEITAVEFDLFLPAGLEVVSDEYGYYVLPGSRTPNKRVPHSVSSDLLSSGAIHVICYHNSQLAFTGEDGDVLAITIKAADDLEPGNYTIDLKNIELVNPADPQNGLLISDNNTVATDIEQIEAEEEGTAEIYDLSGRKVAEPVKGGIYIINGKKVVVNK